MLRLTPLDDRTLAVALDLIPVGGIESWPLWGEVSTALTAFAARIDRIEGPLAPLAGGWTPNGMFEVPPAGPLGADTLRGYVGLREDVRPGWWSEPVALALGQSGGHTWSATGSDQTDPVVRTWGGMIAFDASRFTAAEGYDAASVARHELGHAAFGLGHDPDPNALMAAGLPPQTVRHLTPSDVVALHNAGWTLNGAVVVRFNYPWPGGEGWALMGGPDASHALSVAHHRSQPDAVSYPTFHGVELL